MSHHSLEDKLQAVGSAVGDGAQLADRPVRLSGGAGRVLELAGRAGRLGETCALFDQSHHMTDLQIEGPDVDQAALRTSASTLRELRTSNKAKQFVVCNHDGYVIGDGILFLLDENRVRLVGRPSAHNWVQYHAETGDYDVELSSATSEPRSTPRGRRELYRFQVQGPTALDVLRGPTAAPLPEIKFFNLGELTIGGRKVRALHHGMSGVPGLELWGPWEEREDVQGRDRRGRRGLRAPAGRLPRVCDEHARVRLDPVPAPGRLHRRRDEGVPRVAARERLRGHGLARRELLLRRHRGLLPDAARPRVLAVREVRPRLHRTRRARGDGRPAALQEGHARLERRGRRPGDRHAVREGRPGQVHRRPAVELLHLAERQGAARRRVRSASRPSPATATTSARICRWRWSTSTSSSAPRSTLVWGEEGGGSSKPVVERHVQAEIRAIVSPCPYSEVARSSYHEGWRTKAGAA